MNHLRFTINHKPSTKGQVAVILILVTAAAFIFYAASLNLSRVSQVKTLTTIAADTGASTLGSYMASYGHQVMMTMLGGVTKVCGMTGVIASVISVIVAIIAVIIAVATWGTAATLSFSLAVAIIALILAVASLVLQLAYVQPTMTEKWNEYIFKLMSVEDSFVEQGIQTALFHSVTDQATVADVNDSDQDRVFGFDINGAPLDKISRLGFYYERRIALIPVPNTRQVEDFLTALKNLLLDNGDGWGLFDDTGPVCAASAPSECNPCCISPTYWTEAMGCAANVSADPSIYVPNPVDVASMRATCEAGSPYRVGISSNYPWVYDAHRGNPTNTFVSFQEQLGRDDEHQLFEKNPANPNGTQISVLSPLPPLPPTNFQLKDTTGFYTPAVYPPADNRAGVYPFFYKIADWKVNLDLGVEPFALTAKPNQCHWCDADDLALGSGLVGACPANQPIEAPQLVLPVDPLTLTYNRTFCVDGTNLVSGNPPLAVDRVRLPGAATGLIEAAPAQCAQSADATPSGRQIGFWKRGGDRFCSDSPATSGPYYGNCPKEGSFPPADGRACGDTDSLPPNNWPDDLVDDLVYGLNDFADWTRQILAVSAFSLASTLNSWYPEASQWIERGTDSGATRDLACTSCCSVCAARDGALWIWYDEIREMKTRLEAWRDTSFAGAACTDVWCVPPAGCPGGKNTSGTYNVTFSVSDGSLTDSEIVPITVGRVNNQPPVLNPVGSQAVNELVNLNFTISGSDPDNAALIYSAAGLPTGATFNPSTRVFDWTPVSGTSGTYNVTFSVSDRSLTDSEIVPITVGGVSNQPPVLNPIGSKAVALGVNLNFTISGSDPDSAVLTYSVAGLPTGATFNPSTRVFDWTPVSGTSGTYNVTFSVSDGSLTDSEIVPITVGGVNQAPVLDTIGSRGTNELVNLNFTISGSDPEGAALIYSAAGLPTGATFNSSTRVFDWTPGIGTSGSGLSGGLGPEENTFESNGNGIRGDFTDVAACLNWNVNDQVTTTSAVPVTAAGNDEKFRECDNACADVRNNINLARALDADELCSSLPRSLVPGFDTIAYVPTELAGLLACQTSLTANCGVNPSLTCAAYNRTYTCLTIGSIATEISSRIAAGSCADTTAVGFIMSLKESILEAQNQVVKFRKRYAFLSGRLAEMDRLISVLDRAEREFLGFLTCADADGDGQPDGAACRLIKASLAPSDSRTGMPSYKAVYGWQSEPQKGQPTGSGKWHIVRVDARIPKRCDNSCNWDQSPDGGDPQWPWVKTKVDMWGARRCYELTETNGVVKARVSRYDETSTLATLFFPNAVEIWKPWFTRADRPEMDSPDSIESACTSSMASVPCATSPCPVAADYSGAFLLNERLDNVSDPACLIQCERTTNPPACKSDCPITGNANCWDLAHKLLTQGVTSEACVKYYYEAGMNFKFVPCANF